MRDRPHRPRHPPQLRRHRDPIPSVQALPSLRRISTAVGSGWVADHGPEPSADRTVSQSRPYQEPSWLTFGRSGSALLALPPPDGGTTT
jgi:hypothetical protein